MENVYAALLLHKLGKPLDVEGIKKIVEAAGGTVDEGSIKSLIASLQGVDINKALEEAKSVPVAAASAGAAPAEEKRRSTGSGLAWRMTAVFNHSHPKEVTVRLRRPSRSRPQQRESRQRPRMWVRSSKKGRSGIRPATQKPTS